MTLLLMPLGDASSWIARYTIGFIVAVGLAVYFTPILRDAAHRHGIVDRPDDKLKTHGKPVAYLGGVAIFLSFLVAMGLFIPKTFDHKTLALLLGASIILLLGLIDDLKAMSPAVKLLGQLLVAFVLLKAGIKIKIEVLPLYLADALTVLWVVAITNAFNIIDVMDGLASGVGFVALMVLFIVALINVMNGLLIPEVAVLTICLSGAVLGFLNFNFRPATIYLGDAGSMLLGFLIGSLAMIMEYHVHNRLAVLAPVLLLGVPIFDTLFVMVLRYRQGLPVFRGSPDHFAVRLRRAGVSVRKIVVGSYVASALLGAAALWLMYLDQAASLWLLGVVATAAVTAGVVLARTGNSTSRAPLPKAVAREIRPS